MIAFRSLLLFPSTKAVFLFVFTETRGNKGVEWIQSFAEFLFRPFRFFLCSYTTLYIRAAVFEWSRNVIPTHEMTSFLFCFCFLFFSPRVLRSDSAHLTNLKVFFEAPRLFHSYVVTQSMAVGGVREMTWLGSHTPAAVPISPTCAQRTDSSSSAHTVSLNCFSITCPPKKMLTLGWSARVRPPPFAVRAIHYILILITWQEELGLTTRVDCMRRWLSCLLSLSLFLRNATQRNTTQRS